MYGYEIFHDELMKNLVDTVHKGVNSHAYIFEGDKGLGIHNCARLFASSLTCNNVDVSPCGECANCIEAAADTNPDIIYVRPKKDKKSIGASDMRELEESVAVKPFNSHHKVYIFEDASLLTEEAQNTFLKTFEEPPEYAVFILIAENTASLLQTILSRFTLITFPNVSEKSIEDYIMRKYPQEIERKKLLVKYCGGIPQKVDKLVADEDFEKLRSSSLAILGRVLSTESIASFDVKKYLEENKERAAEILDFWLMYLRDVLLIQTQAADNLINGDKFNELGQIAAKYESDYLMEMSDRVVKAKNMLSRYVNLKGIAFWLSLK